MTIFDDEWCAAADHAYDEAKDAALHDTLPPPPAAQTIPCDALDLDYTLESLPRDDSEPCWHCEGHGAVIVTFASFSAPSESVPCTVCAGTGRL